VVIAGLAPDEGGSLPAPPVGQVVLSVPSPEALALEPDAIRRVIDRAGSGAEPLVIVVEEAETLLEEQLQPVIEASRHAPRSVVLRVIHATDG
jgi:hypothetical protein